MLSRSVIIMTVFSYGLCCCFSVLFWLVLQPVCCLPISNITMSAPLHRNETLVSPGGIFEMGFFQANGSDSVYVGIWFKNIYSGPIVWVANRAKPLSSNRVASLVIGANKNLMLMDEQNNTVWSTNVSNSSGDSSAVLLDNGNFILVDVQSGNYIWSSFDEPCDTLLSGMKIGINGKTGDKSYLVSWKSPSDPALGDFSAGFTNEIPTQPFIWNGSSPYWRGGPWDKSKFIGTPNMTSRYSSVFTVEQNTLKETAYFSFNALNSSFLYYVKMLPEGILSHNYWDDGGRRWPLDSEYPENQCDVYGACGPFGVCSSVTSPICRCLTGFWPKSVDEWNRGNWTGGCARTSELNCQRNTTKQDVFLQMSRMKVPDHHAFLSDVDNVGACQGSCHSNCSCLAYSFVNGIGCLVWTEDLVDIQEFLAFDVGEDLYVRLSHINSGSVSRTQKLIICFMTASGIFLLGAGVFGLRRRRMKRHGNSFIKPNDVINSPGGPPKIFDFRTIVEATDNFSSINKLGQGGFGPVYKGKLQDGKDVAVKRLSTRSGQGVEEFKNEITFISKLQHRNLVKLLGYCVEVDEKILVYDYLSNKSLDCFLFDPKRKLSWEARIRIIEGIARGIVYLHRDSCLRIIHRDLKASNILLDENLNPYISDFGLARIFEGTHDQVNTRRVVGTLGYMAPEYAMGGLFSEKSDVYSFGVLLLEILSSRKNSSFYSGGKHFTLITYAWNLWKEGQANELIREGIVDDSASSLEVMMKCIKIGLLCIQDHAEDRPNMSSVVLMLSGESNPAQPKEPVFTFHRQPDFEVPITHGSILSKNIITDSLLFDGR